MIVYGAGESGARLVLAMQDGNTFRPVALVDDKESMRNKRVGGCRVYPSDDLSRLIERPLGAPFATSRRGE